MKIVFCPKLQEVITIDETKEPKRQKKYRHRSWKPFTQPAPTPIEDVPTEELEEIIEERKEEDQEIALEKAREMFEAIEGRKVPNNKKNDLEWILSKIS